MNGLLPIVVDEADVAMVAASPGRGGGYRSCVHASDIATGTSVSFPIEPFAATVCLNGLANSGYLRSKLHDIERFESGRTLTGTIHEQGKAGKKAGWAGIFRSVKTGCFSRSPRDGFTAVRKMPAQFRLRA